MRLYEMNKSIGKGYFGIGLYHPQNEPNVGTLYRSAFNLGASFCFIIAKKYKRYASDTVNVSKHLPFFEFDTFEEFNSFRNKTVEGLPLVSIEINDKSLNLLNFSHLRKCVYLLGNEVHGIPEWILDKSNAVVELQTRQCMNVSVTGSIIMYDRILKEKTCGR